MAVNKIITKVDGVENKTIDFNDLKAGLAAGGHTVTVEAYNGATLVNSQTRNITIAGVDTTALTITTVTVEDANPDKLVVVFSEVVTITDITGLTITGDATPTLSAPTGSGSNTITFTLSTALTNGQSVTLNVASNNTIKDTANNSLAATTKVITNNVATVVTFEAETTALMNAIATPNDGTATIYTGVTGSQLWTLVNDLVSGLNSNALMSKLFYYYPLLGNTAITQEYNLKDTTTFPLTWYGGWVHDNKGALANGTNTYADTGFAPSANKDVNSNGLSVVIGTDNTPIKADVAEMGCFNGTTQASLIQVYPSSGTQTLGGRMNSQITSVANVGSQGVYSEVKTNASTSAIYKNSVSKATGSGGGRLPTFTTFIGNMSFNDNAPYNIGYSNQRFQGALEHTGLTLTEVQALHSLIDTFEAGIGRKTW